MSTNTQLANPANSIKAIINSDKMREQFALALPKHLSPERFARIAITAISRTPKLADCTQESLMRCLLDLSALGLEPDGRRAHLIPYGNTASLVVDWKGLAELALRSGLIAILHADVVCENDTFKYSMGEVTEHSVDWRKPRGDVYAAYAMAVTKTGEAFYAVMSKDEIEAIRKRSRSGTSGPWVTDWNEMAKKTVFRRLSKWLPLSAEFRDALDQDEEEYAVREVVDVPKATLPFMPTATTLQLEATSPSPKEELKAWLQSTGATWDKVAQIASEKGGLMADSDTSIDDTPDDVVADILGAKADIESFLKKTK